jgi:hypothetical protein
MLDGVGCQRQIGHRIRFGASSSTGPSASTMVRSHAGSSFNSQRIASVTRPYRCPA